ncbi:ABC transporter permease [Mangrovicella endophytica]|uniref:ABC transporter permease n=1 Tax=Mangrovicella endophytica TaxID=2066697 RepID=UPI000C9E151F|nr:ABC transporter permease [Mangrovicella endophytica]
MFGLVLADLRRQALGVLAVALLIALATALGVAVTLGERALRLGSARAAGAFDLVVGAPGSETQLVLSAVFLQPAPLPLLPGRVLAALRTDPRVAFAAPVGFGDFAGDDPVVGTAAEAIDGLGGLSEGRSFETLGEAVVGARVDRAIGAEFSPLHGRRSEGGHVHADIRYRIVGRMTESGTPWDHAILVPIEAVWAAHAEHEPENELQEGEAHEGETHEGEARAHDAAADDLAHTSPTSGDTSLQDGAQHAEAVATTLPPVPSAGLAGIAGAVRRHHPDLDAPVNPAALARPDAPGVPAILVKPRTIADAYTLRQAYRGERSLAVFPAEVLTRLYGTLGDARTVLSAVATGAQALVAAAILLVVVAHVRQRRRQIGALRAFGAPRATVFAIVWLEVFAVVGTGVLAGFGIGYAAALAGAARIGAAGGINLPVEFRAADGWTLLMLLAVTAAVTLVPALLAYRQSPAEALRA